MRRSFVRRGATGGVKRYVKEHYLRDDIYCGSLGAAEGYAHPPPPADVPPAKLRADAAHYLVVDTNIALNYLDLLEHASIDDVVVCGIVLEETRHRNAAAHTRLRALCASAERRFFAFSNEHHRETYVGLAAKGESPNDRNDKAIRAVAKWYATKATPSVPIIMLSDDADNRRKAADEGVMAMSAEEYVRKHKAASPELLDLVSAGRAANHAASDARREAAGGGASALRGGKRQRRERIYADHMPLSELTRRLAAGELHQGTFRVSRYNALEASVAAADVEGGDVLVIGREAINRAVDGDTVAVQLLPEDQWRRVGETGRLLDEDADVQALVGEQAAAAVGGAQAGGAGTGAAEQQQQQQQQGGGGGQQQQAVEEEQQGERRPTGRVVGIIRRGWRPYCGSLQPLREGRTANVGQAVSVLFMPAERKVPKVRILTRQYDTLVSKRVMVAIDRWDVDSMYPEGHYVRTVGEIGDRSTESDMILLEHDVNWSPFTPAVHACVPRLPWAPSQADRDAPWRRDCRGDLVCSVDPPGCRDIDDALGCELLPNGNMKVSVHIADVTHFMRAGTPLDQEASQRATSVYLVERRIDMLPKPLTEEICSLRADVERLTFSVQWEMTPEAEVVKVDYFKALIKSRAALSYGEAQARMDDKNMQDDLTLSLRRLNALAKLLRRKRVEAGALTLASPEVKFEIDRETHDPLDVGMYQVKEANHMVEEFMLLANCAVAEKILSHYPSCALLRRHAAPKPDAFEPLLAAVRAVGLDLDTSSSRALADSLDAACAAGPKGATAVDPYFDKMVRIMATRCMTQAVYLSSGEAASRAEFTHYGLAAPLYTHFTSPIRRYADVMVHRLLSASLNLDPLPNAFHDRTGARDLVANLNHRHHAAQLAGRASVELHTHIFFKEKRVTVDARVIKVLRNGVVVFIPKYGIEGPVYFCDEDATGVAASAAKLAAADERQQPVVVSEDGMSVTARGGELTLRVFDPVDVAIEVITGLANRPRLSITFTDGAAQ